MAADLDVARDYAIEALATVAKDVVNAKLEPILGGQAIEFVYGSPLPVTLLPQPTFPAMCIYRLGDQDQDKGDSVFEDTTTYQFDYYVGATPMVSLDKRWPVLRLVWGTMLGALRMGRDPAVADEQAIIPATTIFRYVLGTARSRYLFAPAKTGTKAYPMLRGQMQFDGCYPSPDSFYDDAEKCSRLDNFETLAVDWNLGDDHEVDIEQLIVLPQ